MPTCGCGGLTYSVEGGKLVLSNQGGPVILTASKHGDAIKLEHLSCQTCKTVYVSSDTPEMP